MKTEMNKYFFVSYKKEIADTLSLVNIIRDDKWMDNNTIIITCCPDYSSIVSQIVNHKLSFLNNNELYEQIAMEIPYPTMSQIWNRETAEDQPFDSYLKTWTEKHLHPTFKYLFIDSGTITGKNFSKIRSATRKHTEQYKFACLYLEKDSIFAPDYYVQQYSHNVEGGLIFEWENSDNPNWNY